MRINIFENYPTLNDVSNAAPSQGFILLQHVYIPGSISFNNVAAIVSGGSSSVSHTISFGLYSLSGGSLSMANSASATTNLAGLSWLTFATSATQDITPGDWWFGLKVTNNSAPAVQYSVNNGRSAVGGGYGGPFFFGGYTLTTNFPVSIATSDISKDGAQGSTSLFPYILISA